MGRLARTASTRLGEMTDGLLAYAEAGDGGADVEVPMSEVVEWVRSLLQPQLDEAGGTLTVEGELPVVRGNVAGLRQVVLNLVSNSIKYRHPDRPLQIRVRCRPMADSVVELSVTDNGIGIPADQRDDVLEAGARLGASTAEGMGLGLSAVRRVVEQHRGRVQIDDGDGGVGTVVRFTLPAGHG